MPQPQSTENGSPMGEEHQREEGEAQRSESQGQDPGSGTGGEQTFSFEYNGKRFSSQAELNQYLNTLTATVREQGRALNQRSESSQGFTPQGQPQDHGRPAPPSDAELNQRFWNNPVEVLRTEMQRMIEPFQRDLAQSRQVTARQQLLSEFQDYEQLEQMIESTLAQNNQPKTYENLKGAYFMVKGYLVSTGQLAPQQPPQQPPQQSQGQNGVPQHRPSNAPMAATPSGGKKRQLTENERRLAREGGMTDEQYLAWVDLNEEDVVTTKIGRPES